VTHAVRSVTTTARPTAVVAEATTWEEFPNLWGRLLDEVYGVLERGDRGGAKEDEPRWQDVMLYEDDTPMWKSGCC
jgi:hypothetical protein